MDILKYLSTQTEQVEVLELQNEATTVEFEANQLKTSKVEETRGLAVRVIRHGKLGYAASSDAGAVEKLAANVLESATYGDTIPLAFARQVPAAQVKTFDPTVASLPITRLVELGREIIDMLHKVEPEARTNVTLKRGIQKTAIRTSAGADIAFERSPLMITVELSRVQNDDVLLLFDMLGTTVYSDDLFAPIHNMVQKLEMAKNLTTIRSGNMPVLFSPSGSLALVIPIGEGLDGKNAYKGISPMANRVGEKIFDEKLSIEDDGTLDGKADSAPYDDEGTPHKRNILIEHGVVKGFTYDLKTAALAGVESTGNGVRSLFNPPGVSPTNIVIGAGQTALQEMIASIDEGLLVEDLLGLGQGNVLSGAFSNPLSLGFKIEKGRIVGRVKDVSIAGNVYDLLQNVSAVSKEREWVYGNFLTPSILIPVMNVAGKN
jgi:PmbA protein